MASSPFLNAMMPSAQRLYYRSTRQETAISVNLKVYCVEIKYFHFNVTDLGINMLHTI